jgi:hypothetical protein
MLPIEKASKLYRDSYNRWCYELSHEKNILTAKDISEYICNQILQEVQTDHLYWVEVRKIIRESSHGDLYNFKK